MGYTITADSYPDYDEDGRDDYWSLADWQTFYAKLVEKYGATEGSKRWLDAWWRNDYTSNAIWNEAEIKDWGIARGLFNTKFNLNKSNFFKPEEFVPPTTTNQGQVVTNPESGQQTTVGNQDDEAAIVIEKKEEKSKNTIWWVVGGLVVALGVAFIVLKVKQNKAK